MGMGVDPDLRDFKTGASIGNRLRQVKKKAIHNLSVIHGHSQKICNYKMVCIV
jgi:hypothetical protein